MYTTRMPLLPDVGCSPFLAMTGIRDHGVVSASRWPGTKSPRERVPIDVLEAGSRALVTGFFRAFAAGADLYAQLCNAVDLGHPILFGMPVGEEFGEKLDGSVYSGEASDVGNHAMTIIGYDETGFQILNSWGDSWGDRGTCTIDAGYMIDRAFDFTAFQVAPEYLL
jgi:hypothetical protein